MFRLSFSRRARRRALLNDLRQEVVHESLAIAEALSAGRPGLPRERLAAETLYFLVHGLNRACRGSERLRQALYEPAAVAGVVALTDMQDQIPITRAQNIAEAVTQQLNRREREYGQAATLLGSGPGDDQAALPMAARRAAAECGVAGDAGFIAALQAALLDSLLRLNPRRRAQEMERLL